MIVSRLLEADPLNRFQLSLQHLYLEAYVLSRARYSSGLGMISAG